MSVMGNYSSDYTFKCIDCGKEYQTTHWENPSNQRCLSCKIQRRKETEESQRIEIEGTELNTLQTDLVDVLKKNGALTRNQMVEKLSKPRTTIYDNLAILMNRDMIKKFIRQVNPRGRPVTFFKLKEE